MNRVCVALLGALCGACIARGASLWLTALCAAATVIFVLGGLYLSRRDQRIRLAEERREASDAAAYVARTRVQTLLDGLRSKAIPAGLRGHSAAVVETWAETRAPDRTRGYVKALDDVMRAVKGAEL